MDGTSREDEAAEARDVGGAKGQRLPEDDGERGGLVELESDGEVTGEQAEANRALIGMEAGADQMVEIMAVAELVNCLLDAAPLSVEGGQALRAQPLDVGDIHPGATA